MRCEMLPPTVRTKVKTCFMILSIGYSASEPNAHASEIYSYHQDPEPNTHGSDIAIKNGPLRDWHSIQALSATANSADWPAAVIQVAGIRDSSHMKDYWHIYLFLIIMIITFSAILWCVKSPKRSFNNEPSWTTDVVPAGVQTQDRLINDIAHRLKMDGGCALDLLIPAHLWKGPKLGPGGLKFRNADGRTNTTTGSVECTVKIGSASATATAHIYEEPLGKRTHGLLGITLMNKLGLNLDNRGNAYLNERTQHLQLLKRLEKKNSENC